ncbi:MULTISPECIES: class I SAM-dependent methyltransferase [Streptomyces]|uniref:class I SAM-dependent methyltransferase n=1 Tax=Streptomyces TaxID=1883 RepID=UPI002252009B|nr:MULTISPECIES: class I SAM-dependent methyltransferase [Streptomyces]MCX5277761.1 class I SAM-dependent methyltransferase [Streptomyces virginiae]MCX5583108.1 class I SAM-dependent methyltransferase [Streptomyces erythrochromogenes]
MTVNPFLDTSRQADLYGHPGRLAGRTSALMRAKTAGRPVPETIASLVNAHDKSPARRLGTVADIGCGRGTSSRVLAERLRPLRLVGIDASAGLLAAARERVGKIPGVDVSFTEGDFHQLPLGSGTCDVTVAAFCLYHSPQPERVIEELSRALAPQGLAVLVTKSLDSYSEMDGLVATSGLDPYAGEHESLYASAHSGNLADLARYCLDVIAVAHEEHVFHFGGHDHVAEYLATNPKYDFAPGLYGNPAALAASLHEFLPDQPVTTTSVITYVVARRRKEQA